MSPEDKCRARSRRAIQCDGEFIESEGLCFRHAVLFDYWICEKDGWRVYKFNPDSVDSQTIGEENPEKLRRWKRAQFHKWLDTLTEQDVKAIMES